MELAESRLGNMLSDIIFEKAKKVTNEVRRSLGNREEIPDIDFAVTNSSFLSHGFYKGPVHTADIYDAMCKIYNHDTKSNWHLFAVDISGENLKMLLNAFLSYADYYLNLSHAELIYRDTFFGGRYIHEMNVGGKPFDPKRIYRFVTEQGIVDALWLIKENILGDLEYDATDLGLTYWEVLRDGFMERTPISLNNTFLQGRMRSDYADLAVYSPDIEISSRDQNHLVLKATVFNLGNSSSTANLKLTFYYDETPLEAQDNPDYFKPPKLTEIKIPDTLKVISSVRLDSALKGLSRTDVEAVWDMGSDAKFLSVVAGTSFNYIPIYVKIGPYN